MHGQRPESYWVKISARDNASRQGVVLSCLRLPVIIIKAVSPTVTAEQSSHLERWPLRRKIKKDRTVKKR